jgi:RNA polymerase sigma-70 factor (ECF subfamily)
LKAPAATPHVDPTDEQLMLSVRNGHRQALDALVRRYEVELYRYLKRYVGDSALADDVFQNTFMQVFIKRGSFDPQRRFKPWLYAVATNQAVDALRRAGRGPRICPHEPLASNDASEDGSPLQSAEDGEVRERVRAAVDRLPDHLKQVVLMTYFQGLKYRDVAEALRIPVGTVKSRLFAAVQLLQQRWQAASAPETSHGT